MSLSRGIFFIIQFEIAWSAVERANEDRTIYACMTTRALQHCPTGGDEIDSHDNFLCRILSKSIVDKCPDNRTSFSKSVHSNLIFCAPCGLKIKSFSCTQSTSNRIPSPEWQFGANIPIGVGILSFCSAANSRVYPPGVILFFVADLREDFRVRAICETSRFNYFRCPERSYNTVPQAATNFLLVIFLYAVFCHDCA